MTQTDLIKTQLPLNRKERFFTGTVFPMIVCRDNFKHFGVFASLVKGLEPRTVSAEASSCDIQFFTEYSLVESIYDTETKERLRSAPRRKDTPDIMILLAAEPKALIALEAKMYDNPTDMALIEQMTAQKAILDYLQNKLSIKKIFHCALLPAKLSEAVGSLGNDFNTITWEEILRAYQGLRVYEGDYFLETLRLALELYDMLVSRAERYGQNCERKLTGREIFDGYNNRLGEQLYRPLTMGRNSGATGAELENDINSGRWATHIYETSSKAKPANSNWFTVEEFVGLVNKQRARSEIS